MHQYKHTRQSIDKLVTEMHSTKKPHVAVTDVTPLANSGFARVTASVTHTGDSRENPQQVIEALSAAIGSKMRPIAESFMCVASNKIGVTITGILSANPETVAYEEGMAGYKAVAGNMFMDEEEDLWALRTTEAGSLLVKSRSKGDADVIADLMQSLSSSAVGTMGFEARAYVEREHKARASIAGGDFITFVNPRTEQVEFGAAVASVANEDGTDSGTLCVVACSEDSEPVSIDRGLILAKFDDVEYNDDGLVNEQTVEAAAHSLEEIAAYYKQVFQRDLSYFEEFMARWRKHAFA